MNNEHGTTISIIVPVYNVEKYLRQCIDSVLAQTFTDFELILVDDGSTDRSGKICDEYTLRDNRICVLHKANGGQAEARNLGIDHAKGKYITFVDSDDVISSEYLNLLYSAIQENHADISSCGSISFTEREKLKFVINETRLCDCITGRALCADYYRMNWTMTVAPWGKLYKAELLEKNRFPSGKIYEDQGTVPRLWYTAQKVAILKDCQLYAYRIRTGSTTHSAFSKRRFEDVGNVELCRKFFAEANDPEMEELCTRFRNILQAKYIVLAHHHKAADQIPDEYQMSLYTALRLLRREIKDSIYTWYLSLARPKWVKIHSYVRKIEEIFGFAKTER